MTESWRHTAFFGALAVLACGLPACQKTRDPEKAAAVQKIDANQVVLTVEGMT